ncbi:CsbD family protein, partial [Salmonella enterica]|nr:CsbD family protein [Salmonella enterica]
EVVRDNVENNPFAAISIAAGVGLLIGLLIGRK